MYIYISSSDCSEDFMWKFTMTEYPLYRESVKI